MKSKLRQILVLFRLIFILGVRRTVVGVYQCKQETYSNTTFSKPMSIRNRISFVNELAVRQKKKFTDFRFLEIGPYMSPILNKEEADYFDVLDTEALIERSKSEGTPHHLVANVDYVGPEASDKYIPYKYSLIVSSHVVEHQIDLIKHLNQVHDLLVPGGLYVALIPDLRYCFDHFQNPSTVVDAITAYFSVSSNHTLSSFLDDRLLTSHNNPLEYWRGKNGNKKIDSMDSVAIYNYVNEYSQAREYLDVHAWKFTPITFKLLIETLFRLEMTQLKLQHIAATFPGNNEFWVIFER